jgi:hypothetical protein
MVKKKNSRVNFRKSRCYPRQRRQNFDSLRITTRNWAEYFGIPITVGSYCRRADTGSNSGIGLVFLKLKSERYNFPMVGFCVTNAEWEVDEDLIIIGKWWSRATKMMLTAVIFLFLMIIQPLSPTNTSLNISLRWSKRGLGHIIDFPGLEVSLRPLFWMQSRYGVGYPYPGYAWTPMDIWTSVLNRQFSYNSGAKQVVKVC